MAHSRSKVRIGERPFPILERLRADNNGAGSRAPSGASVGDILYLYGFCGMIVYLLRKVKPAYLVLGVPLVAAFDFSAGTLLYREIRVLSSPVFGFSRTFDDQGTST